MEAETGGPVSTADRSGFPVHKAKAGRQAKLLCWSAHHFGPEGVRMLFPS